MLGFVLIGDKGFEWGGGMQTGMGCLYMLTGEDGVHDGYVLVREVAGDGEDEDPRVQGCGWCGGWVGGGGEEGVRVCG